MTLVEFLLARIAEDEADARKAEPGPWMGWRGWLEEGQGKRPYRPDGHAVLANDGRVFVVDEWGSDEGSVPHIARWNPARVLSECEAKRRIVKLHAATHYCIPHSGHPDTGVWYEEGSAYAYPCPTLSMLSLSYAGHPDYDDAWRQ